MFYLKMKAPFLEALLVKMSSLSLKELRNPAINAFKSTKNQLLTRRSLYLSRFDVDRNVWSAANIDHLMKCDQ